MILRNLFRVGVFIVFIVIILKLDFLFVAKRTSLPWDSTNKVRGFYKEPKNSLDVIFVGSSHAYCTFNPVIFYKENAIKSYVFSANEQPLCLSYYYIKEALKYQNPKVIVLEVFYISEKDMYKRDAVNRVNIDDIKPSKNKMDMIVDAEEEPDFLNLYSLNRYHNRWKDLGYGDFVENDFGFLKGYTPLYITSGSKYSPDPNIKASAFPEYNYLWLKKIMDLCKNENIPLVFVYAPYRGGVLMQSHAKEVEEIAAENNIDYYNFADPKLLKEINFDFMTDMEKGHTNIKGATKVSKYLSNKLGEKYSFDSNRDFNDYIVASNRLEAVVSIKKIKTLNNYLDYLKDKDLHVLVLGEKVSNIEDLQVAFSKIGSKIDFEQQENQNYIGIFNPYTKFSLELIKNKDITYKRDISKVIPFQIEIKSSGLNNTNKPQININNSNYLKGKSGVTGINIVVYDSKLNKVIDVAYFNVSKKSNPVRNKIGG